VDQPLIHYAFTEAEVLGIGYLEANVTVDREHLGLSAGLRARLH